MKTMMLVAAVTALAGCGAATPVPADKLARAQETLRQAEAMPTTATDPKAMQHLQLAKNQLQYAKKLMTEGENEDAKWVLMRADADAEAALYLAHAQAAKTDAQQTIDAIRQAMALMQQEGSGS
jgi:predicted small lipoprotein YifL